MVEGVNGAHTAFAPYPRGSVYSYKREIWVIMCLYFNRTITFLESIICKQATHISSVKIKNLFLNSHVMA